MSKKIRLTESELHELITNIISEQFGPGPWSGTPPGPTRYENYEVEVSKPVRLPGSMFPIGKSEVNKNSVAFKNGIFKIQLALAKTKSLTVKVTGGVSAVPFLGDTTGKRNIQLGNDRANNFIEAAKSILPNVNFIVGNTIVGTHDKPGPEADKEQFVQLDFMGKETETRTRVIQAVDHTANQLQLIVPKIKEKPKPQEIKYVTVCYTFPEYFYDVIGPHLKKWKK